MFWHGTSVRKAFFSKVTCSSTSKEFLHILFLENCSEKKKNSEKLLAGLVSMNIFTDTFQKLIKLTCRSLSKQSFSKCSHQMCNVESFGRHFSLCPSLIWRSHSCLISFRLYDGIWWKLKACVRYFSLLLKEQCASWLFPTKYFEKKFNLLLFYIPVASQTFIHSWATARYPPS